MEPEDALFQAAHEREAAARGTATRILNFLRELEIDTAAKLQARIDRLSQSDKVNFINGRYRGQYSTERLERLLAAIREASSEWRRITEENIKLTAKEIAAAELSLQTQVLAVQGVIGESIGLSTVVSAAYAEPLMAKPLREYFKDQEASVRRTITDSLRRSFVAGETTEQAIKSLIGTKALKYTDGDLRNNRNAIRGFVRTSLNHISNVTTQNAFRALAPEGSWQFRSVIDGRTSTICKGLSNTVWKVSNRSAPYPPRHFSCRSYAVISGPEYDGMEQTSNMAAGPKLISADDSYETILKRQPVAWQRDQFTALQWKLWRSGKVNLRGLSDTKGTRELTDGQLRERYSGLVNSLEKGRSEA